jgi:hypothetical protein
MAGRRSERRNQDRAFGEYLVSSGLLRREALRQATDTQSLLGGRLDTVLLDLGLLGENALLHALGRFRSTRTVSSYQLARISPEVARTMSSRVAIRLEVVPFRREGRILSIATLNPSDLLVEDELAQLTDCMVASFVALEVRLYEAMARLYGVQPSVQVLSVLERLEHAARVEAPSRQDRASAGPQAGEERSITTPAHPSPRTSVADPDPERPQVLEITREELRQFPSLADEVRRDLRLHGEPPNRTGGPSADELLERAGEALENAQTRDDIADAVLAFCAPLLARRLLLAVRGDTIVGWRGAGEGVRPTAVEAIAIPATDPSVFTGLLQGAGLWLGPLPRTPSNDLLARALGGASPAPCIVLPLVVRSKTVAFLYGDNAGRSLAQVPIPHFKRLLAKAGLALQIFLLRSKIRHL